MPQNPFETESRHTTSEPTTVGLSVGTVTNVYEPDEDNRHSVQVITERLTDPTDAIVTTPQDGDVTLPTEGSRVLIGYFGGIAFVLGNIPENDRPNTEKGERVVSHPLTSANISLRNDGSITAAGDDGGTVAIDDAITATGDDGGTVAIDDAITIEDKEQATININDKIVDDLLPDDDSDPINLPKEDEGDIASIDVALEDALILDRETGPSITLYDAITIEDEEQATIHINDKIVDDLLPDDGSDPVNLPKETEGDIASIDVALEDALILDRNTGPSITLYDAITIEDEEQATIHINNKDHADLPPETEGYLASIGVALEDALILEKELGPSFKIDDGITIEDEEQATITINAKDSANLPTNTTGNLGSIGIGVDDGITIEKEQGPSINIGLDDSVTIDNGSDSEVTIKDDGTIDIKNQNGPKITIDDSKIQINSADEINLNGGDSAVARKGDTVEVTDGSGNTYTGQITDGSDTVSSG